MRKLIGILAALLLATPAMAGGTKFSTTVVAAPNTCSTAAACNSGTCTSGLGACASDADCAYCTATNAHCAANTDCATPALSAASKADVSGSGIVKFSVKGVLGANGEAVTTDGIPGTSDDYIVRAQLLWLGGKAKQVVLKLELDGGKGTASGDASAVLPTAGMFIFPFVQVLGPPTDPALCPGGNEPADIAARAVSTDACIDGRLLGMGGLLAADAKTKLKSSFVPYFRECVAHPADCNSGTCSSSGYACSTDADCQLCNGTMSSCTTNGDCNAGAPSAKSKIQMTGAGDLKMSMRGVLDAEGQPLTTDLVAGSPDDYIVNFLVNDALAFTVMQSAYLKTDFEDGKAKLSVNVSAVLPAAGTAIYPLVGLLQPPTDPAACPGTNDPAAIAARIDDADCRTGETVGVSAVVSGQ